MHPILLTFRHFVLPTYGVLVAVAALSGVFLARTLARRAQVDPDRIWTLGALAISSAILGSKGLSSSTYGLSTAAIRG